MAKPRVGIKRGRSGKKKEKGRADQDPSERIREQLTRFTVPPDLDKKENRDRWKLEVLEHGRGPYLIELNVQHVGGLPGAAKAFLDLYSKMWDGGMAKNRKVPPPPVHISKSYFRCDLRVGEWRALVAADERDAARAAGSSDLPSSYRAIYKLWPDFPVRGQISRSVATIKADAALRSFEASGDGITWAVLDSGVFAEHPHFAGPEGHVLRHGTVNELHRCFAPIPRQPGPDPKYLDNPDSDPPPKDRDAIVADHRRWALNDDFGHGTHVAGIIAGSAPEAAPVIVLEREDRIEVDNGADAPRVKVTRVRAIEGKEKKRFRGVAPACRLISVRVLDENGEGRSSDVIRGLAYIRETLNDNPKLLRVHGVNLSIGYEFDAEMFACGQSPLCTEVNRLVQAGVVVVAAAGNTGYGAVNAWVRATKVGLSNTINDPGNAELAITVGATHRDSPHTYGVSYFSSKGPTGDGRLKPDLVAPGERILSCAAGGMLQKALEERSNGPANGANGAGAAFYVEDSGTSMAAPHVSGAIAAFLSIRREFVGRPLEVKKLFLESAIGLGRERYFEGHGLIDLMKAIQSV